MTIDVEVDPRVDLKMEYLEGPIYLSGPMNGVLDHNYPMFNRVTAILRKYQHIVFNPAENFGGTLGLPREAYMRLDISHVLFAKCLVVLPGWSDSNGAQLEVSIARELGLPLWRYLPHHKFVQELPYPL